VELEVEESYLRVLVDIVILSKEVVQSIVNLRVISYVTS
jgi:hypothetical protein